MDWLSAKLTSIQILDQFLKSMKLKSWTLLMFRVTDFVLHWHWMTWCCCCKTTKRTSYHTPWGKRWLSLTRPFIHTYLVTRFYGRLRIKIRYKTTSLFVLFNCKTSCNRLCVYLHLRVCAGSGIEHLSQLARLKSSKVKRQSEPDLIGMAIQIRPPHYEIL